MTTAILFGVRTGTLEEARTCVEKTLSVSLIEREGLHAGGIHFTLGQPRVLGLKNNIDLDEAEIELNGLSEPDFPRHPFLLYLFDADAVPNILTALEATPNLFAKLRTRTNR